MKAINRYISAILLLLTMPTLAAAQEPYRHHNDNDGSMAQPRFDDSALQRIMPTRFGGRSRKWREEALAKEVEHMEQHQDSLNFPPLNQYGQPETIGRYPIAFSGWSNWALHRGLNVQLGASVFTQFGKGARGGAGFQQNIAMMYAMPVTDKLSVAIGGYLNNVSYAGGNWRDAGLSAVVGYRFNDHWEAYIYAQKSITNNLSNRMRYSLYDSYYGGYGNMGMGALGGFSRNFFGMPAYSVYDLYNMGDRIGATVRYNVNNNLSTEVATLIRISALDALHFIQ